MPATGVLQVTATQSGIVQEVLVREGDHVEAGQPILRLQNDRMTHHGEASLLVAEALSRRRNALDMERALMQQHFHQRQEVLVNRLHSLQTEQRQTEGELATHRSRVELAAKSKARFEQLGESGFVSTAQVQQQEEAWLDLKIREKNALRNMEALRREIRSAQGDIVAARTQLETNLAQLQRNFVILQQEELDNELRSGLTITAPQTGIIGLLSNMHVGQAILIGQTMLHLVPTRYGGVSLEAQLYATSRMAGFVRSGQVVWLRYDAYPFQKFGVHKGVVTSVSQTPIPPGDLPTGQAAALAIANRSQEPLYRISVRLQAQSLVASGLRQQLKAGTTVQGDVQLETRTIWEWMLEPILSIKQSARMSNELAR